MRALLIVALLACSRRPLAVTTCENLDLVLASAILADAAHPCHARVDAAYGRMMASPTPFSGTVVSLPSRGAGLFLTCQHCTGADGDGLHDPETDAPSVIRVLSRGTGPVLFIHRLFARMPPRAAFDAKGNLSQIEPRHDFVIGTISGTPVEVVDAKLAFHDPARALALPWADPQPGSQVLVLGFPRDLPDHTFGGELVASVGEVLDDARAKDMISRADPDEARIPYDPSVEFVITARGSNGMSGGGAFDGTHRYLGVAVRGTVTRVDGRFLTRVVRARYVFEQLDAALARASAALRAKLAPFLR